MQRDRCSHLRLRRTWGHQLSLQSLALRCGGRFERLHAGGRHSCCHRSRLPGEKGDHFLRRIRTLQYLHCGRKQKCSKSAKTKMTGQQFGAGSSGSVDTTLPQTTTSQIPKHHAFAPEWVELYQESQNGPSYWAEWEHYEACAVDFQGHCHYMKQKTWAQYLSSYYGGVHSQRAVWVPTTHDGCATWQSPIARQAIFGDTDACRL